MKLKIKYSSFKKAIKLISTLHEKTFPFCKIEIHISQKLTQAVIAENQIGRGLNILNLEGIFLANFQQKKIGPCSFTTVVFCKRESSKGFSFNLNSLQDRVLEYAQHSWLTIAYIIIIAINVTKSLMILSFAITNLYNVANNALKLIV